MIHSPQTARDAGIQLLRGGFGSLRSGTIKFVHARGAVHGTTLCGKTLREPHAIGSKEYLGQYMLCTACQRKLNAVAADDLPRMSARAALTVISDHWMPDRVPADVAPALDVLKQHVASAANLAGLLRQTLNYMDHNSALWNEAWAALEAIDPELTKAPF